MRRTRLPRILVGIGLLAAISVGTAHVLLSPALSARGARTESRRQSSTVQNQSDLNRSWDQPPRPDALSAHLGPLAPRPMPPDPATDRPGDDASATPSRAGLSSGIVQELLRRLDPAPEGADFSPEAIDASIDETERAVQRLGDMAQSDPRVVDQLLQEFLSGEGLVFLGQLGRVLGSLSDPAIEKRLREAAAADPSPERRAAALHAVTRLDETRPEVIKVLAEAIAPGVAPHVRQSALTALALKVRGPWPAGLQEAVAALADDTTAGPLERSAAWHALRGCKLVPADLDRARRTALDPAEAANVRIAALGFLGAKGGEPDRTALRSLVEVERNPIVRRQAELALQDLIGRR